MAGLGLPELLVILAVVLLLFGSKKLPDLAKSLGKAQREFKKGMKEGDDEASPTTPPPAQKAEEKADG